MAIARDNEFHPDRGRRDARHHHERIRDQIRDHLRERIGEEDIITAGPEKRLRVPIKGEKRYRFIFDRGRASGTGQGDGQTGDGISEASPQAGSGGGEIEYEVEVDLDEVEEVLFGALDLPRLKPKRVLETVTEDIRFDDVARKGPLLDKKASLRENLLRNAKQGRMRLGGLERDDLRYRSYKDAPSPRTQAVVICIMDISGSIGPLEKRISRLFYYWTVRFLRRQYTRVEVAFIGHTSEAFELSEQEFFTRRESGGTLASSAFRLAEQVQRERYPEAAWNVYLLYTSDGDNLGSDNAATLELIAKQLRVANLVGYLEILRPGLPVPGTGKLSHALEPARLEGLVVTRATGEREIWPALKKIFAREGVEQAVAT
jgi:sporulation protein YhbH